MANEGIPDGRVCTKCGKYKPLTEYSPHARGKYGRQPRCRKCCDDDKLAWIAANPERYKALRRGYLAKSSAKNIARVAAWTAANRERANDNWRRGKRKRRVRELGAPGSHTEEQWRALVERGKGRCAMCHRKRPLTQDHVIPLSRGGSDDITNIQPLCRSCNSKKNAAILYLI